MGLGNLFRLRRGPVTDADQLDHLSAARGGPGREPALIQIFTTATRFEIDFWQMGLNAGG